MQKRAKSLIIVGTILAIVVIIFAALNGESSVAVKIETVEPRDLVASVSASGKVQPKTKVDISTDISGRITKLAVKEGDTVVKGQFLLEIDPSQFAADVDRAVATVAGNEAQASQARANLRQARSNYDRIAELRDRNPALVSADQIEKLRTEVEVNRALLETAEYNVVQAKASLRNARSAMNKATIVAPMTGRVTRLNIQLGETAIMGTLNRDAATLLTIADMSTLETKVKVDETEISRIRIGDSAVIQIDAFPDTTFRGIVTDISNSSVSKNSVTGTASDQAVDYEVTVQLLNAPPNTRPDFTSQARIITATRHQVLSIPIIALTVREHTPIANGDTPLTIGGQKASQSVGQKDVEGVFVIGDDKKVTFRPVRVGVSGENYFEVLSGLRRGEKIVAGPYQAIRELKDGTPVKQADTKATTKKK